MRYRMLTATICSLLILASYVPGALAESPPQDNSVGDLAPTPDGPQPPPNPCAPLNCQDIPVVIVACLDLVNGCDDPVDPTDPTDNDFEFCFNLNNEPCDPPADDIDDLLDPSGQPDPGGDGDDEGDGGEPDPGDPVPENPTPVDPNPPAEPGAPNNGSDGANSNDTVDIDIPRPGNPNFAG